jgi:CheY-like chemotaxis protein
MIDMTSHDALTPYRVLLVDDDEDVRSMTSETLESMGFKVVCATSVNEALGLIASQRFDALVTDLHMPRAADGFTVVTAMRASQPDALTVLVSAYPDVQSAMNTILLEADAIMVKPYSFHEMADLMREKIPGRRLDSQIGKNLQKQRVAVILQRCIPEVLKEWLKRVQEAPELKQVQLSDDARTGHLPKLVADLIALLGKQKTSIKERDAIGCASAEAHGALRYRQGYTPAMLVHESRILQVTLFGTLQHNLSFIDFSLLLPDVMTIADEVDAQLTHSMEGYMRAMQESAVA